MITASNDVMADRPRVLLLIESSRGYGRGCLSGVATYLRSHGHWNILHFERGLQEAVPDVVDGSQLDGVITRTETEDVAAAIKRMDVPTVDLRGIFPPPNGVTLVSDASACSDLAMGHFSARGIRNVAYCGFKGLNFSDERGDAFEQLAIQQGFTFHRYPGSDQVRSAASSRKRYTVDVEQLGEMEHSDLADWLSSLPKPSGVFCCNDVRGRQVLAAAQSTGLMVPKEVAVLGVDDDEVVCELASPPLSSIEPDSHRMGYEAARILDQLMAGETVEDNYILVPPFRLSSRLSTDTIAIDDEDVISALQYIRGHAFEHIGVADIAKATSISRATLERRFRRHIGRSPKEELERVRIERIQLLLVETNYGLEQIAAKTGYRSASHVVTLCRRIMNCTPGEYRSQFRHSR